MLTQNKLKEYLYYEPNTGHFTWLKKPSKKTVIGSRAGTLRKDGYRNLMFMGKNYPEHHLVWLYEHGKLPKEQLDHINHIRDDNRISNLREVSISENSRNRTRRTGRVDEAGIWWCKRRKRYIAEITLNQKKVFQRSFVDVNEAISQRQAKLLELGFHHNHGDKL